MKGWADIFVCFFKKSYKLEFRNTQSRKERGSDFASENLDCAAQMMRLRKSL